LWHSWDPLGAALRSSLWDSHRVPLQKWLHGKLSQRQQQLLRLYLALEMTRMEMAFRAWRHARHRALKDSFTQLRAQSEVSLNTLSTDTGWDAKSAAKNCLSRGCILDESCSYHTLGEYCYRGARQPCCFASGAPFDRDNVR